MRILYIACGSGSDQTIGGSLARTLEIAKRIAKNNHVYFLTTSGGRTAVKGDFPADCVFEIKTPLSGYNDDPGYFTKQLYSYLCVFFGCFSVIRRIPECDLVYTDSDGLWDIIPAFIYRIKNSRAKWIAMTHHLITLRRDNTKSFIFSLINTILQRVCFFLIAKSTDAILILETATGEAVKDYFTKLGYKKKFYSVRNGIDLQALQKAAAQEKKYAACFFGFLRPSKGLYDLVPIWKEVVKANPQATLLIIGGILSTYRVFLEKEIARDGLQNNIIIKGYVADRNESIKLVKQCHIFISPSHEEGWGITVMECLACGLPGVVWNLASYEKIIKSGVVKVPLGNLEKFAKEVTKLLAERVQEEEIINSISQYDWDNIAELETEILKDASGIKS